MVRIFFNGLKLFTFNLELFINDFIILTDNLLDNIMGMSENGLTIYWMNFSERRVVNEKGVC